MRRRFDAVVDGELEVSRRDDRWLGLGPDIVAFAGDDDREWARLQQEAWIIERWRAAGVPVARVIREDAVHRVQVRERLHGLTGDAVPPRMFGGEGPRAAAHFQDVPLTPFGERLAASYGELAARIRRAIAVADAGAAGLATTGRRSLDLGRALAALDATDAPSDVKTAARRARHWLADVPPPDAVIHADLHFHNLCISDDGAIAGVFDLGDAGIDAAATELLYIHSLGPRFVAAALAAYGAIDKDAVCRAHVRTALEHLLWHGPGTPRHASVIEWIAVAFGHLPEGSG